MKNPKSDVSLIAAKKATSSRKIKMDNDEPFSDTIKVWIAQEKVTLNIGIRFWHSAGNKEVEPKRGTSVVSLASHQQEAKGCRGDLSLG